MDLEKLDLHVKQMSEKLDKICEAVVGDPTNKNSPGLLLRLDRAEQTLINVKRGLWILFGAAITSGFTLLINVI